MENKYLRKFISHFDKKAKTASSLASSSSTSLNLASTSGTISIFNMAVPDGRYEGGALPGSPCGFALRPRPRPGCCTWSV